MNIPRSSLREYDDIVNLPNYEALQQLSAVLPLPDSDRLRVGSVTD